MSKRPAIFWRIALGLLAAVALAACGGDSESSDNGTSDNGSSNGGDAAVTETVTVETKEFSFTPDSISIAAGSTEVVVDNSAGVVEHDFTIDALDVEIYAAPGTTESEVIEFEAGTYEFYCSIPGHREAGMEGTLTVS